MKTTQLLVLHQETFPLCKQSLKCEVNKTPPCKALNKHAQNCSCSSHLQDISLVWHLTALRDNFAPMFAHMSGKELNVVEFLLDQIVIQYVRNTAGTLL